MIATASELFEGRHYPGVVAMCTDALDDEPECVPILLMRARAHIALRRELDAQADLRDVIRLDPQCALAYRLLGEIAARRDDDASAAAVFFREALRLDPGDREAAEWLLVTDSVRPAAVAQQLPAPATAAGRFSSAPRVARGTDPGSYDERPTKPFPRGTREDLDEVIELITPKRATSATLGESPTLRGRPATYVMPAKAAPRLAPRPLMRAASSELPGFGDYLVATGILTRERLRAAQAYQRSMRVQLSTAIITLGLATPQRVEWASVAHQSELSGAP